MDEAGKARNRLKSKVRARGEHPFAFMTMTMGGILQRCIGLLRNSWGIALMNLVYNLCRYEQILRLKLDTWNRPTDVQVAAEPA